jgi:hypothetical protein
MAQNLELGRLASNGQIDQLRNELAATRVENELNLKRIDEFQTTHRELQRTYDELTERYTVLQQVRIFRGFVKFSFQSFEELQNAASVRAKTEEKSTDALMDGSTIDRICDLNSTIEVTNVVLVF